MFIIIIIITNVQMIPNEVEEEYGTPLMSRNARNYM